MIYLIHKPEHNFLYNFVIGFISVYVIFLMITWGINRNQSRWIFFGVFSFTLLLFYTIYKDRLYREELKKYEEYKLQKKLEKTRLYELKKRKKEIFEQEMRSKGLQKVIRRAKEVWVTPEQAREWKFIEVDLDNNFQKLSPRAFEKAIADLFKKLKYDVKLLPYAGDYGADLIIKKENTTTLIQCKKYKEKNNVGAPTVQRTLGSMYKYEASKAIIITTSDFTKQAWIQAQKAPIKLWNKRKLREQFEIAYLKT